ncbi:MAG TPA: formyltransferase family protein [Puia sp.]|jgi:methionyl-tRNA formyltransferase|nr:formyltransferase family protein [Puia sp.]
MKRIAFLGAKGIGLECLKILDAKNFPIAALFTDLTRNKEANQKLIDFAKERNIPVYEDLEAILSLPGFDYIISIQYHKILKGKHIGCAKKLALNLHMAPLPEYRGCNQFSFAIVDGKKEFGTTLHKMAEGIDNGDIIAESRFDIPANCFVKELHEITYQKSIRLFEDKISDILNDRYTLTPQDSLVPVRGTKTIYRKDIDKLKEINLDWDKDRIERHIRATLMPGFEPPFFKMSDKKVYFSLFA